MTEAIRQGDVPGVQLRVRQTLARDRVAIWPWLVEPERLAAWFADRVVAGDGGRILELEHDEPGTLRRERLTIRETVAPLRVEARLERLGDGWDATTAVTLELAALGPGSCELSVFHAGFQNLALSRCLTIWEDYRRRWRAAAARLATATGSA